MAQDFAAKQADDRRKTREDAQKAAAKGVADRRAAVEEANAASDRRTSGRGGTPTPTQEENDLAKVGALNIDEKQDDGSGPDRSAPARAPAATRVVGADQPAPYTTRTGSASTGAAAVKKD